MATVRPLAFLAAALVPLCACGTAAPEPAAVEGSPDAGAPDGTPAESPAPAAGLLAESDFVYLGYYSVTTSVSVGWNVVYSQGLALRQVGDKVRFLSLFYPDTGQPFALLELEAPASLGQAVVQTNRWNDVFAGGPIANTNGRFYGLWWEEAKKRLWTTSGIDYPDVATQGGDTASVQVRALNDDGTISGLEGPWGLAGTSARAVMGGVTGLPADWQSQHNVGPYAIGFGGYASLLCQTVSPAVLGPTLFAIPEPAGRPAGDLPFTTLLDFRGGSCVGAWYPAAQAPWSFDRGVRNTNVTTKYDDWVSPAPDGLGRWTWGDSAFQTGVFIDGPRKRGYVIVPSFATGNAWYEGSTLNCDGRDYEIQVFDPDVLGDVASGSTQPWAVKPSSRWVVSFPGFGAGGQGNGPGGNMAAAAFDARTSRLYVYGVAVNGATRDAGENRIFVFQVAD